MVDPSAAFYLSAGPLPLREDHGRRRSHTFGPGWHLDTEADVVQPVHRPPMITPKFCEIPMSTAELMLPRQGGLSCLTSRRSSLDTRQRGGSLLSADDSLIASLSRTDGCPMSRDSRAPPLSRAAAVVAGRCDLIDGRPKGFKLRDRSCSAEVSDSALT